MGVFRNCEADEEVDLDAGFLLSLAHCVDELLLIEFLARNADDAVNLLDHMDLRSLAMVAVHLDQVVHIVTVKSGERGYIDAVTLALFKLVKAPETRVRVFQIALLNELVIMVLREEGRIESLIENQTEAAL